MYHVPRHIVAVSGCVTNAAGEILMVKSPRRGWEFPGGQVEEGESLTEALKREIQEESGVIATPGSLFAINSNLTKIIMVIVFRAVYVSGELKPQPGETEDVRWFTPEAALNIVTHPVTLQRVKDALTTPDSVLYRAYTLNPYEILSTETV